MDVEAGEFAAERERIVNANVRQIPGQFETSAALLGALQHVLEEAQDGASEAA